MALPLAFGAALLWGAADFLAAQDTGRAGVLAALVASQPLGLAGATAWVALSNGPTPAQTTLLVAAVGGAVGVTAVGALWLAMNRAGFGLASPISATGVAIPFAYGLLVGRSPAPIQLGGCGLAVLGLFLTLAPQRTASRPTLTGVGLALAAAVGFGFLFVAVAAASRTNPAWALLATRLGGTVAVAVAVVRRGRPWLGLEAPLRGATAAGLLEAGGSSLYALATHHGRIALAAVAASLYPAVTALLARLVLRERMAPIQRLGTAFVLLGAALLASG
jgi:drug/metabolite transporter (DMT)-like permease